MNERALSLFHRTRKITLDRQPHPSFLIPPPGGPWIPRLEEIVWNILTTSPSLLFDITPSVLAVRALTLISTHRVGRGFVDQLPTAFQNLSQLDLRLYQITPDGFDALIEIMALHRLPKLRQLRLLLLCGHYTDRLRFSGARLMSSLEAHPSLERLSLLSQLLSLGTWSPASSLTLPFASLRRLEFERDQDGIRPFLRTLSEHGTRFQDLDLGGSGSIRDVTGCIQGAALFHASLKYLKVVGNSPSTLPHDLLTCLSSCRNLKTLDIACNECLPITDEDLKDLVSDLSQLRELRLGNVKGTGTELTLGCLAHLANSCPKLEKIALYLYATRFGDSWDGVLTGRGLGNLTMMDIRENLSLRPLPAARVAGFLRKLGMQPIRLSIPPESSKYWRDVLRLMREVQGS